MLETYPLHSVTGSIHLCFKNEELMRLALDVARPHTWQRAADRPLCLTSSTIDLATICRFSGAMKQELRAQIKVTFIPDMATGERVEFLDYFNVNNLDLLHARCEQMSGGSTPVTF
ncbi:MAG: hypothetical protein M3N19_06345 [Candidatus Eremiobacteraeota bacterium]|nr:hypothetical protein [Candidatus Eremiobacteraeota bacterium]